MVKILKENIVIIEDEAFLRRIQNKIFVSPVSDEVFDQIFNRLIAEKNLVCEPNSAAFLRSVCFKLALKTCRPVFQETYSTS